MFDNDEFELEGARFRVTFPYDDSGEAPWEREDGHAPVSEWRRADSKAPGERELCRDGRSRFYDFAEACRIARKDGWGVPAYRIDTEKGANGLVRLSGQWFKAEGRGHSNLLTFSSEWCDDINDATMQIYAAHRATMPPRQYAAAAAEADFERLRAWCNDQWCYVGVVVELLDEEGEPTGETDSIWGIESDSTEYLAEVARECAGEILARIAASGAGVHSEAGVSHASL